MLDLSEFAAGQESRISFSPRLPKRAIPQIFFEILGNTCGEGALRPCEDPFTGALGSVRRPRGCRIAFRAGCASQLCRRYRYLFALLWTAWRIVLRDC